MANLEVSSATGEVSVAFDGVVEVASVVFEIATIIPDGEAAVASAVLEVAISFPPVVVPPFPPEYTEQVELLTLSTELHIYKRRKRHPLTGIYEVS